MVIEGYCLEIAGIPFVVDYEVTTHGTVTNIHRISVVDRNRDWVKIDVTPIFHRSDLWARLKDALQKGEK